MCIIKIRPRHEEEEDLEVVVPSRPVTRRAAAPEVSPIALTPLSSTVQKHHGTSISRPPTRPLSFQAHHPQVLVPLSASQPRISMASSVRVSQTSVLSQRDYYLESEPSQPAPQVIVIEQRPRASSVSVRTRQERASFTSPMGGPNGEVGEVTQVSRANRAESYSRGHGRSASSGRYGKDPRASNTSYRSTREKIIVVDEQGLHRKYYR